MHKVINKLNNENLKEVLEEYKNLSKIMKDEKPKNIVLKAIKNVMEKNSPEQVRHLEKTSNVAALFASHLFLSKQDKRNVILLARFHDIGKINISKDILNKPGKLNDQEWQLIKEHPLHSKEILMLYPEMKDVAIGAFCHHERFDGTGYPSGLAGTDIPLIARIISILDTFEVLTSGRVYREPVSVADALQEIERCAGTQFDPFLVEEFTAFIAKQKIVEDYQQ